MLDLLGIIAWVLEADAGVSWGLSHRPRKMVFQLCQGLVSLRNWLEQGLYNCPNLADPFYIVSLGWV